MILNYVSTSMETLKQAMKTYEENLVQNDSLIKELADYFEVDQKELKDEILNTQVITLVYKL